MVREDVIASAISFLQDPSVSSAPLEKRIAFLQSKNLTQEEIDVSLTRVGEAPASSQTSAPAPAPSQSYTYRQPSPPPPQYGSYPPGFWQQPPPPELPKRDWRDWFIMATVMGGVGYGLYFTAKRYILPLVKPPTPPQLEQDKSSIDESFNRTFALLDQLTTDTTALKASEEARTERLDAAISEMETMLASLKESARRRDDDSRRIEDDVRNLRDLIPKALDAQKESTDSRLKDLGTELKSLKTLVGNRMAAPNRPASGAGVNMFGAQGTAAVNGSAAPASPVVTATNAGGPVGGAAATNGTSTADASATTTNSSSTAAAASADKAPSSSPYARFSNGRAAIPAWQLAASKKNQAQEEGEKKDTAESGTAVDATNE